MSRRPGSDKKFWPLWPLGTSTLSQMDMVQYQSFFPALNIDRHMTLPSLFVHAIMYMPSNHGQIHFGPFESCVHGQANGLFESDSELFYGARWCQDSSQTRWNIGIFSHFFPGPRSGELVCVPKARRDVTKRVDRQTLSWEDEIKRFFELTSVPLVGPLWDPVGGFWKLLGDYQIWGRSVRWFERDDKGNP